MLDYTEGDIESWQAAIDTVEDLKFKTSKNTTDPEADGEDPDIRYKVSAGDDGGVNYTKNYEESLENVYLKLGARSSI